MPTDNPATVPVEGAEVHYLKGNQFRVIYAEGAYGGLNPHGMIAVSLYSERAPIPRKGILHQAEDGTVGEEIVETRLGIVREIEATLVISPDMAARLSQWLLAQVDLAAKLREERNAK